MLTLKLDLRPVEQLENDLDRFGKHALPDAIRDTLNSAVWDLYNDARDQVGRTFIERNKWTRNSIRYNKATGRRVEAMRAEVGSLQEYMAQQEAGFVQRKSGAHGVAIPTPSAAGQNGAQTRTRALQRRNWLTNIKPPSVSVRGRGRTIAAVREALRTKNRIVFIDQAQDPWGRPTGFYRVLGGRRTKSGWPKGAKLRMIYSTDKATVRTAPHRWLEPATEKITQQFDRYYRDALIRQIRINRCFRDH